MTKTIFALLMLLPATALAHLDHGSGTYSLAHYFTGSHLFVIVLSVFALLTIGHLVRKYIRQ